MRPALRASAIVANCVAEMHLEPTHGDHSSWESEYVARDTHTRTDVNPIRGETGWSMSRTGDRNEQKN